MKANTHPSYSQQTFTCSCGNVIEVASTMSGQGLEICSNCHPFYTGKQKMIDSAGRIERFASRYTSIVGGKRKSRKEEKSDKETTEKASAE